MINYLDFLIGVGYGIGFASLVWLWFLNKIKIIGLLK